MELQVYRSTTMSQSMIDVSHGRNGVNLINIRTANLNDDNDIRELVLSLSHCYLENPNAAFPQWLAASLTLAQFHSRLTSNDYTNVVSVIDDVIVGYLALKGHHLFHLFVAQEHQGKGIAKQLWHYATAESSVTEYTVRSSLFAVPVYKCFGFRETSAPMMKDGVCFQPMALVRK